MVVPGLYPVFRTAGHDYGTTEKSGWREGALERPQQRNVVVSNLSCGLAVIEFEQASQPRSGLDFASGFTDPVRRHREQDHIPLALMVSLSVKMIHVLREHLAQGRLAEQDQFRQALLFCRSGYPRFRPNPNSGA